jgi:hypothetical protein
MHRKQHNETCSDESRLERVTRELEMQKAKQNAMLLEIELLKESMIRHEQFYILVQHNYSKIMEKMDEISDWRLSMAGLQDVKSACMFLHGILTAHARQYIPNQPKDFSHAPVSIPDHSTEEIDVTAPIIPVVVSPPSRYHILHNPKTIPLSVVKAFDNGVKKLVEGKCVVSSSIGTMVSEVPRNALWIYFLRCDTRCQSDKNIEELKELRTKLESDIVVIVFRPTGNMSTIVNNILGVKTVCAYFDTVIGSTSQPEVALNSTYCANALNQVADKIVGQDVL